MADTDPIEVTFLKQTVFHDGTNMQVKKAGDTMPVDRSRVQGFIDGKNIEAPEGWEADVAEKNSQGVADGGFTTAPSDGSGDDDLSQLDHDGDGNPGGSLGDDDQVDARNGFTLTETGGGWWQIEGATLVEPVKVRGEDAARARFVEIAGDTDDDEGAPA